MRSLPAMLLVAASTLLAGAGPTPASSGARTLPAGVWGGDGIRMEVTREGAEIEFDCARGAISQPLVLDPRGHFRVQGTYRADTPAPMEGGDGSAAVATYSGTFRGATLRLEVSVAGQEGTRYFELIRGQQGRLAKCA